MHPNQLALCLKLIVCFLRSLFVFCLNAKINQAFHSLFNWLKISVTQFCLLFVESNLGKKPLSSVSNNFDLTELAVLRHCGAKLKIVEHFI